MSTTQKPIGSGAANAPGQDARKTDSTTVAEEMDSFDRDLHGEDRAGQHGGASEIRSYTAYDVKELHEAMPDFDNGELKRIPVLAHGERLEQGATYLDLTDLDRGPFVGHGSNVSQDPHRYVPKAHCDYELWNKLTGKTASE
ncbi:MAG: hypothetical protein H7Z41_00130 [Cytophagales bacterium]|nr:hypothetical protein [Armatimonadota bacterium]